MPLLSRLARPRALKPVVQWQSAYTLCGTLATEAGLGRLPHEAFAAAITAVDQTLLPAGPAAQRANDFLLNPFMVLADAAAADVSRLYRVMAMAFDLAVRNGAPLAAAAEQAQQLARDRIDADAVLEEEVAGARLSAWTLMSLPLTGLVFGPLVGGNPLQWLLTTPVGRVVLAVGCALQWVGWRWSRVVLDRALR